MQGGGFGTTSRTYGMNSDNVLAVRMMLADGRLVRADASRNHDLWWAVRGGTGNNFGVLLEITYQLYPMPQITTGEVAFSLAPDKRDQGIAALMAYQAGFMAAGAPQYGELLRFDCPDRRPGRRKPLAGHSGVPNWLSRRPQPVYAAAADPAGRDVRLRSGPIAGRRPDAALQPDLPPDRSHDHRSGMAGSAGISRHQPKSPDPAFPQSAWRRHQRLSTGKQRLHPPEFTL